MIVETEKFNVLCDQLETLSRRRKMTPEEHGEALDLQTQARVLLAEIDAAGNGKLSKIESKISQIEIEVDEPDEGEEANREQK